MLDAYDIEYIESSLRDAADKRAQVEILKQIFPGEDDYITRTAERLGIITGKDWRKRRFGQMIQSGVYLTTALEELHMSKDTALRYLAELGIEYKPPRKYTAEDKRRAVELYDKLGSYRQVGATMGITPETVGKCVRHVRSDCDMQCETCARPVSKCHGGGRKSPYTDPHQKPIKNGEHGRKSTIASGKLPHYTNTGRKVR